jgi:hypothetical protein
MIKPQQPWWRTTNRTILVVTLLLCVAAAVGGAYLLGLLDQLGMLHWAEWHSCRFGRFQQLINAAVGNTEMPGDGGQTDRTGDHLTISTD